LGSAQKNSSRSLRTTQANSRRRSETGGKIKTDYGVKKKKRKQGTMSKQKTIKTTQGLMSGKKGSKNAKKGE